MFPVYTIWKYLTFYEGIRKAADLSFYIELRQLAGQDFTHIKLFIEHSIYFPDRCSFTHNITEVEDHIFFSYDVVR